MHRSQPPNSPAIGATSLTHSGPGSTSERSGNDATTHVTRLGIPEFDRLTSGLAGIAAAVVVAAIWQWTVVGSLRYLPIYVRLTLLDALVFSLVFLPIILASALLMGTAVMWYGRLLFRFSFGALMLFPGFLAYMLGSALPLGVGMMADDYIMVVLATVSVMFGATAIAVVVQLTSRWVLVHSSHIESLPQTGIGMLAELTLLASIATAVIVAIGTVTINAMIALFFVSALSAAAAGTGIATCIVLMAHEKMAKLATFAGLGLTAVITAGAYNHVLHMRAMVWATWIEIIAVAIASMILTSTLAWLQLTWLRRCGWHCIDRRSLSMPRGNARIAVPGPFE